MAAHKSLQSFGLAIFISLAIFFSLWLAAAAQTPEEDVVELGADLYRENCAVCHGEQGEGRIGANLAKSWSSIRPELTIRTTIKNGIPGSVMPAWSQDKGGPLTEDEIEALVLYILSWQTGEVPIIPTQIQATKIPPITPIPEVIGDPNRGAVLFGDNCTVCHGANGEGRIGATLLKAWPAIRADLSIKGTIQRGLSGTTMPAWDKENGGPLSEDEINDIVAFILSRSSDVKLQSTPTIISPSLTQFPWLRGWGGIALFVILLAVFFLIAILIQRKPQ